MTIVRHTRADFDEAEMVAHLAEARKRSDAELEQDADEDGDRWTKQDFERATRVFPPLAPQRVTALRERLGMTQRQFATRFGIPIATVEAYELGHWMEFREATPLLMLIEADPEAAMRVLHAYNLPAEEPAADPVRSEAVAG